MRWWERDTTPGYLLLVATVMSFLISNSTAADAFHHLLEDPFASIALFGTTHDVNLHLVINDGLMAIFFFYVGLELKRETAEGPFRNPREAALPMVGAAGGMLAPALIFLLVTEADEGLLRGWGIPVATDIAFAVGVLSVLGSRVPAGLRLFLLALAIVDDLGAILVIAIFYTTTLNGWALAGAALTFGALIAINVRGVRMFWPYCGLGLILWAFMLGSGVHATIAGVLAAASVPMRDSRGESPLTTAEHALKPWVVLAIMPLFALANAGVPLSGVDSRAFLHPVTLGVGLGLVFGKPVGIVLSTFLAAAWLKRTPPANLSAMIGVGMLAGVGFTMSLFIGGLAFQDPTLAVPIRFGVLGGSLVSAVLGLGLLAYVLPKPATLS